MVMRFDDSDPGMAPAPPTQKTPYEFDISAAMTAVWHHKLLMLASILTALLVGVAYIVTTPDTYRAAVQVMIVEEVAGTTGVRPSALGQNEVMLESAQKVLESQSLALAVVDELSLLEVEAFTAPAQSPIAEGVQALRGFVGSLLPSGPGEAAAPPSEKQQRIAAADALREAVVVYREGRSSAFTIRYDSTDPALAAAVVNAYGDAFVSDQLIGNVEASARVLDWLRDRLQVIQENSTEATMQVEEYRARNGLLTIDGDPLTVQTISQLSTDLSSAIVELARTRALSSVYAELRELDPVQFVESGAASARIPDAEFSENEDRILNLLRRQEQVERQFGPDHVEVRKLRALIETEGAALQRKMQRMYDTSLNAVRTLEAEVSMLRDSINEISAENLDMSRARADLLALERQAETLDTLNETYLLRLKDLEQTQTFPVTNVRVLSEAEIPKAQIAPRKSIVLGLMLVLGTIIGAVLSVVRASKQRVIRTREDVQEVSMRPFFGYLPLLTSKEMQQPANPIAPKLKPRGSGEPSESFEYPFTALSSPRSLYTETLRNIRVATETSARNKPGYVLGIASVRPGEGKTTVAANLAALVAGSGRSVLLVDGDIRTSGLSRMFGQSMGIGLREVLYGRATWKEALRREATTGMLFLPSTFAADDPAAGEIAAAPAFRNILNEARQHYDLTIIDLPPLGPVSDARALQPVLDGAVMVLEWGKMKKDMLRNTLSADPALYQKILGMVLNRTNMKALEKYTNIDPHEGY
ncbi:MAG: AAA family ATPase [Rhodobacterales bacterium]|nr:AAA family ATPase [Rhodobacterales bacterium]MDX5413582.1 AAA family ATPase [Rhodobacterales bacterium]